MEVDARAKSNTEARAPGRRVGVMRTGPESDRAEVQPPHGRQQGQWDTEWACGNNYEADAAPRPALGCGVTSKG